MALIDVTPVMTSNTEPSPYVISASSQLNAGEHPYLAFNGTAIDNWDLWLSKDVTPSNPQWLKIDFGSVVTIDGYMLQVRVGTAHNDTAPNDWVIEGSNDDEKWIELDSQKGKFVPYNSEEKIFKQMISTSSYRYFRIKITRSGNFETGKCGITQLRFYKEIPDALSIHKTLKENLPSNIEIGKDELHFTEDGGIYISDKDGNLVQCNTGEIIKEINNPLTTSTLEYGSFRLSQNLTGLVKDSVFMFDKPIDGNMSVDDGKIYLSRGKTYCIDVNLYIATKTPTKGGIVYLKNINTNENVYSIAFLPLTISSSTACSPNVSIIYTPKEDCEIQFVCSNDDISEILAEYSSLNIQEVRNNPVNQYGGFQTEVLFDGNANEVGEYQLSEDINEYDFIIAEKSYSVGLPTDSIIPPMTSSTSPAPYIVTAGQEDANKEGYRAFDGMAGDAYGNHWYYNVGDNSWIQISVGSNPIEVSGFSITNVASNGGQLYTSPPKSFDFEYSSDGTVFEIAKSVTNMKTLNALEEIKFELDVPIKAKFFRFKITKAVNFWGGIGEIKIFGKQQQKKSIVNLIKNEVTVDNENEFYLIDDTLHINKLTDKAITKIVGIKGQLPSLLVGGEF